MDQLISTFHIDIPLVVAQILNFALVFLVLYFFAIKPLLKMMSERSKTIEDGLKNAELSEKIKDDAEKDYKEVLDSARVEADGIILSAHDVAQQQKIEILKDAEDEKDSIIKNAQGVIDKNQAQAELEFRTKSAEVVVDGLKKMFDGYVAKGKGDELIKQIIEK